MNDSPANPLEPAAHREQIATIADRYLDALRAGERPDQRAIAVAHPSLAPGLSQRLALVEAMFDLARAEATPPSSSGLPGKIGRFEILDLLGRGAFGAVYRARDSELDRIVAIKVPRAGLLATQEDTARFLREARSAARLRHPAIVSVHEIGFDGALPYIVSDCIMGQTLAERNLIETPAFEWSARLCARLADALEHAHLEGIVHRDVKPQNILLDATGRPHITDFGLARRDDGEATITIDGQVLGTPAYMSPEQAAGEQNVVGPRSDIYSLGVVLYELLTGERPFRGSRSKLIDQVLHDEPRSPRSWNDRIPLDLETVCLKAMSKEPHHRYVSANDFGADLQRFLAGEPVLARPVGRVEHLRRWARRKPLLAALSAAVALLIAAVVVVSADRVLQVTKARDRATQALLGSEERLVRLSVSNGTRLLDDGDPTGALVWFAEALRLEHGGPEAERAHRIRIGTLLSHTSSLNRVWFHSMPVAQAVWSPDEQLVLAVTGNTVSVLDGARGARVSELVGHSARIERATFSPNSRAIATCSADSTARVWEAESGQPMLPPLSHEAGVSHVAYSPDGQLLVTASLDRSARLWNSANGELLTILAHGGAVRRAFFSPSGDHVITTDSTFAARVWELRSREPAVTLQHRSGIEYAEVSPDGTRLVTATRDQTVQMWELLTGKPVGPPLLHDLAALHATFSPDGRRLATTSYAITARVWDAWTGAPVTAPLESTIYLERVEFRPDGQLLLSSSIDGSVRLWNPATGRQTGPALKQSRQIRTASFSPGGCSILTASDDGTARLWNHARGQPLRQPLVHRAAISSAGFSRDGRLLVTSSDDRTAQLWEAESGERRGPALLHNFRLIGAEISSDGRWVLTSSKDGARLWDAEKYEQRLCLKVPSDVVSATLSADALLVAATGTDGTVQVWQAGNGMAVGSPLKHGLECRSATFSTDARLLATGSHDQTAQVWEVLTGRPVGARIRQDGPIHCVAFSPDGLKLATAGDDGNARVWNARSGEPITEPLPQTLRVARVTFGPDGRFLAAASFDATAQVWDATSGRAASPRLEQGGMLRDAAFSPDGSLLATASGDGTARVWDWRTGEPVTPLLRHSGRVNSVRFSPSGRQVLTASQDGTAKLWDLFHDDRPVERLLELSRLLSGRRISASGGLGLVEAEDFRATWERSIAQGGEDSGNPPDDARSWHHREALAAEQALEWTAALWHLDRLPQAVRERPDIRVRRARAHAALGAWEKAAAEYREGEAAEHGGHDVFLVAEHAVARLLTKDITGYREGCERLVDRVGASEDPLVLNQMAWTCVLGPEALRQPRIAVNAARKALAASPNKPELHNTVGAALCRAGDNEAAVQMLGESARLEGWGGTVWDWLFLALATHKTGRTAEAREWLARATAWAETVDSAGPGRASSAQSLDWRRRAELTILLAEARALIGE